MKATERVRLCPVCGSTLAKRATAAVKPADYPSVLRYYRCNGCGLLLLSPRFTDAYTKEYYAREYREDVNPLAIPDKLQHMTRSQTQMQLAGHLLTGKTMLELGCSSGYLLDEFKERGFKVTGVDPDKLIEVDKNTRWFADIADVPAKRFDVIALSHTLEHFNNPLAILKTLVKRYAKKGTRFLIDVPNQPECYPWGVYRQHHPIAFDLHSMTYLMEAAGIMPIFDTAHANGEARRDNLLVVGEVR